MSQQVNTPASLLALHRDDPRKLDALAHETVFQQHVEEVQGHNTVFLVVANVGTLPNYSASLDAAALLEARLAERGQDREYAFRLIAITGYITNYRAAFRFTTATATQRTIAAILAAQEVK